MPDDLIDRMVNDAMRQLGTAARIAGEIADVGYDMFKEHSARRGRYYAPEFLEDQPKDHAIKQLLKRARQEVPPIDWGAAQLYTITVPASTKWEPERALALVRNLTDSLKTAIFRIVGEPGQVIWQIIDLRATLPTSFVEKTIQALYPRAEVEVAPYSDPPFETTFIRSIAKFGQENIFPAPIGQVGDLDKFDPLISLTQVIGELQRGERVTYTLFVTHAPAEAKKVGEREITTSDMTLGHFLNPRTLGVAISRAITKQHLVSKYATDLDKAMRAKLAEPLFHCLVTIQVDSPEIERLAGLFAATTQMRHYAKTRFNALLMADNEADYRIEVNDAETMNDTDFQSTLHRWITNDDVEWRNVLVVLEPSEIAALWHLPHQEFTGRDIVFIPAKQVPIPKQLRDKTEGVRLGFNQVGSRKESVFIPPSERTHHAAIVGKTGVGKSTLLHQLIRQDIAAGHGVAVIDPLGKLVRRILQQSIPPEREDDVVILDITYEFEEKGKRVRYPPPMNLLAKPQGVTDDVAAGIVVEVLSKIYEDGFATSQMAHTLRMALMTLAAEPTPTLYDVDRLFNDGEYRDRLLAAVDNIALNKFWSRIDDRQRTGDLLDPVLRRLDSFYANPLLRSITCHPDRLDFASLIRDNKIILVSLEADDAKVPEVERLVLGATIISQIQMAAMSGAISTPPYLLYIDEVHQFTTTSLPKLLAQARNNGLGLYVATQFFDQLAGKTLDALLGNVGSLIAFEVNEPDARKMLPALRGFDVEDLVNQGTHRAAVSMRASDGNRYAFSLETEDIAVPEMKKAQTDALKRELMLRRKSVKTYTPRSAQEVKAWFDQRYKGPAPTQDNADAELGEKSFDDEFIEGR